MTAIWSEPPANATTHDDGERCSVCGGYFAHAERGWVTHNECDVNAPGLVYDNPVVLCVKFTRIRPLPMICQFSGTC